MTVILLPLLLEATDGVLLREGVEERGRGMRWRVTSFGESAEMALNVSSCAV